MKLETAIKKMNKIKAQIADIEAKKQQAIALFDAKINKIIDEKLTTAESDVRILCNRKYN